MALTIGKKQKGDYGPCPEGVHQAICFAIYDLGTQHNEKFNKDQHNIAIFWEIPDEKRGDGKPHSLGKTYTVSLHEKARLRRDLEAWRGSKFTPEELESVDLGSLIGNNCQVQVMQKEKGGKVYSNIVAIMSLPKAIKPKEAMRKTVFYEIESGTPPEDTPKWIEALIKKSREWKD